MREGNAEILVEIKAPNEPSSFYWAPTTVLSVLSLSMTDNR